MSVNNIKMKKTICILALLLTTVLNAQLSAELKAGVNSYLDSGSYSENKLHGGFAVSYAWNRVSLRPSFNMGQLENSHAECNYSEDYINTNLDLMYRMSDGWIKLYPYVGLGYTKIGNNDLLNLNAGGVAKIFFTDTFYLLVDISGSSLYGLKRPLGYDRDTAPRGTQAVNLTYTAGIGFDILKPKKKKQPQKIIERHIIQKQPIVNNLCNDCKEFVIPQEHVFFEEGKYRILQSELNAITNIYEFLEEHPDTKVECVGSSCSNQGSDKRNFQLSELRAKQVHDKLISMGIDESRIKYKGTGKDKKYSGKDSDVQKRVSFIIYK